AATRYGAPAPRCGRPPAPAAARSRRPAGGSDELAAGAFDPFAQLGRVVGGDVDEAEAGPVLARHVGAIGPEVVGTDVDGATAVAILEREAQLEQRVVAKPAVGDQHHPGLGDVADAADRLLGHGVPDFDDVGGAAALRPAVLGHAPLLASASGALPENERKAPTMAFQARSMMLAWPSSTTLTLPRCNSRASQFSEYSPTRWPRWLTNRQWPVTVLYQDRRRRTRSPCWLTVNSNQVPKGRPRRRSITACSSGLSGASFSPSGARCSTSWPSRERDFSHTASSVREAASMSSSSCEAASSRVA